MIFLLALAITIFAAALLTKLGVINPYLAGAAALNGASLLHLPLMQVVCLTIAGYLSCYFCYAEQEVAGVSTDLQTSLSGVDGLTGSSQVNASLLATFLRLAAFIGLFVIGLPKPPAYITGIGLIGLTILLVLASSERPARDAWVILWQTLLYGICVWLMNRFAFGVDTTIALLSGASIARLAYAQYDNNIYSKELIIPNPLQCGATFALSWLTPGLSLGLIGSALFPTSIYKGIWLGSIAAGMEGWALRVFLNGESTTKTMLGELLSSLGMGLFRFDAWASITVGVIVVACMVVAGSLNNVQALSGKPARALGISLLVMQSVMMAGAWMIPFILVGLVIQYVQVRMQASNDSLATSLMIPVIFG